VCGKLYALAALVPVKLSCYFFKGYRRRFPIKGASATAISKPQGQTLQRVRICRPSLFCFFFPWPAPCGIFSILFIRPRLCCSYWRAQTECRKLQIANIQCFISRSAL